MSFPKSPLSPRKEPQQDRSRFLVDAILGAAARVLVEDGYEGATTARVAKLAGVSIGSLYQYFPTLDSLVVRLYELLRDHELAVCDERIEALRDEPLVPATRGFLEGLFAFWQTRMPLIAQLAAVVPTLASAEVHVVPLDGRAEALVLRFLESRVGQLRDVDPALAAMILSRSMMATLGHVFAERPELLTEAPLMDELVLLATRYLTAP